MSSANSWRSSATTVNSCTNSFNTAASSSISAGVAWRPAKTPKLTRTSIPGSSCFCTRSEIAGSFSKGPILVFPLTHPGEVLTLSRLPAELEHREDEAPGAPGRKHGQIERLRPDGVAVQVDGVHEVDEVLEGQYVADGPQDLGIAVRRSER